MTENDAQQLKIVRKSENDKKTNKIGAYTSRNNRTDGELGTELVHGEKIIVEYYEPLHVYGQGVFTICNVIHGYRSLDIVQKDLAKALYLFESKDPRPAPPRLSPSNLVIGGAALIFVAGILA